MAIVNNPKIIVLKKLLLILLIAFGTITTQSQVLISLLLGDKLNSDDLEFGLEGGGNFSSIIGLETKKYVTDWNLGFYFDIKMKKSWFLYTGVLVKAKLGSGKLTDNDIKFLGIDTYLTEGEGNYYQKINYFLVPVLAKYKFKNRMYLEAGPQFGLMYKAWAEYRYDDNGKDAIIKQFNKDMINRIDAGIMGGFGYRFKGRTGWTIGFKYYYGLANVYKEKSGTKNNSLFLKVNIPIGAGEDAQRKREENAKKRAEKKALKEKTKSNK